MGRISTIRLIACAAGVAFAAVYLHAGDLPPIQPTTSPNASVAVPRDVYKWLERAEADVALIQDPKAKLDESKAVTSTRAGLLVYDGQAPKAWALAERQTPEVRTPSLFRSWWSRGRSMRRSG